MILVHDGIIHDKPSSKAVLFLFEDKEVWIPKSVLTDYNNNSLEAENWFCEKEGLEIYEQ